jgi:hypothetical protein
MRTLARCGLGSAVASGPASSLSHAVRRVAAGVVLTALSGVSCASCTSTSSHSAPSSAPNGSVSAASGTSSGPASAAASVPLRSQRAAPVESNPPGDIPDTIAYVPYRNTAGRYGFVHPEGWASVARGGTVTFTDKLNGITAAGMSAAAAPTVASAKQDVARLRSTEPAFELRSVQPTTLPGWTGVLVVFRRNSAPDAVTGRVVRDEVNRYAVYRTGRLVVMDLYGPVGSDNVDPYTKISQSLRLS